MSWTPGTPALRALWSLDPSVTFVNHGSFGATPRVVLEAEARWRAEMEREPVRFFARDLGPRLRAVRQRVAAFVGGDPDGLVLVKNATSGVNAVLRSLAWSPGDEILVADQTYHAVRLTAAFLADQFGVRVSTVRLPFPLRDPAEVVEAWAAGINRRTRLLLVDHLSSPTALVFPVEALVALARERGVPVLVDGAHAPGQLPLALESLGADFYVGNLHKWAFTPKGCAILHVAAAWRDRIHPPVISHGYGRGLGAEFDFTGTDDVSGWLAIPDALDFYARFDDLPGHLHALVRYGRARLAEALGVEPPHPDDPRLYAAMAALPFPVADYADPAELHARTARLFDDHRIEVPFTGYDGRVWIRISAQAYNAPEDYDRLASVLASGWR